MKAVVLIPVLVLGLTWTFQGVPAEEVEGTAAPTNTTAADTATTAAANTTAAATTAADANTTAAATTAADANTTAAATTAADANTTAATTTAADAAEKLANEVCSLPLVVGPCKRDEPRFFYSSTAVTCVLFSYGGCHGNLNNFGTVKECMEKCSLEEVCNAPPAAGIGNVTCFRYFPSYFYNATSKSCERFIYGGCGGNQNRFKTEKACLKECDPNEFCKAAPVTGPCEAAIPRYFYNSTAKSCEIFTYGGCGGNQNNFKTEASCLKECHHEDEA